MDRRNMIARVLAVAAAVPFLPVAAAGQRRAPAQPVYLCKVADAQLDPLNKYSYSAYLEAGSDGVLRYIPDQPNQGRGPTGSLTVSPYRSEFAPALATANDAYNRVPGSSGTFISLTDKVRIGPNRVPGGRQATLFLFGTFYTTDRPRTRLTVTAQGPSDRRTVTTDQVLSNRVTLRDGTPAWSNTVQPTFDFPGFFDMTVGEVVITISDPVSGARLATYRFSPNISASVVDRAEGRVTALAGTRLSLVRGQLAKEYTFANGVACNQVGCFLTEAATGAIGLSDDCWELETLRAYRDGPLRASPAGRDLVERYYRTAPGLVAAINGRGDASRQWRKAYWSGIVPTALLARLGWHDLALASYGRLVRKLERLARSSSA